MSNQNLARRWRPQTFEDLVGQQHIAQTLLNAIRSGRLSHGYLFTGTRGVGKTSAARIFAKALRCQQPIAPGISCNTCTDCTSIAEGRSVDVLEIDGASNNGVDSVREIRENAKYLPNTGSKKIYIIDEVHMLTTAAFNALLKTLEEPPAHVTFIFATTDPQKIPPTVLSRCQRHDFRRVPHRDLEARLAFISEQEGFKTETEALSSLAREAEGSMRDAVSLLEQVLASQSDQSKKTITSAGVTAALGLVDKQTLLDTVTALLKRDPIGALDAAGKVHLYGFDLKQFGKEVLRYLRSLLVVKLLQENQVNAAEHGYLDVSDVDAADLKELSGLRSVEDLDMMFRALNYGMEDVARSAIPKIVLDVLLIKLATARELVELVGVAAEETAEEFAPAQPSSPQIRPQPTQAEAPKPAPAAKAAPAPKPVDPNNFWKGFVAHVKAQKPLVGNTLDYMGFVSSESTEFGLVVKLSHSKDHSFHRDQLQSKAYSEILNTLAKSYLGRQTRFEFAESKSDNSLQAISLEKQRAQEQEQRKAVLESEALRATQQLLGGRLEKLDITSGGANE